MKILKIGMIYFAFFVAPHAFSAEAINRASIFELLSTPDDYDSKRIKVIGYLHKSGSLSYELYPYEIDVAIYDKARAIRIDPLTKNGRIDLSVCENKYVEIFATFSKSKDRNLSDIVHSIEKVLAYDKENKYMNYSPCYSPE